MLLHILSKRFEWVGMGAQRPERCEQSRPLAKEVACQARSFRICHLQKGVDLVHHVAETRLHTDCGGRPAAQFPMLAWVFGAVILVCLVSLRSIRGVVCILVPLALVSLLAYALMAALEIGLKVSTLPVVALGVGIGVDYGIYIYARFRTLLLRGKTVRDAFYETLQITGNGVLFTGTTLGVGVATWIVSPLKFQADMGVLLFFLFVANMLAALVFLPALARVLFRDPAADAGSA